MREISEQERRDVLREVTEEFPDDDMMREIHLVRRLHQLQTEGMGPEEKIAFYRRKAEGLGATLERGAPSRN
jgi:hypothetical protein